MSPHLRLIAVSLLLPILAGCPNDGSDDADVKMFAPAQAVNAPGGTVTLLGLTVEVTSGTRIRDQRDQVQPFTLGDVTVGDWLEVEAFETGVPSLVAERLEREQARNRVELEADVDSTDAANHRLVLQGVLIDASGADFENRADDPITEAEFFSRVSVGTQVKAQGTLAPDGTLVADEVELE